MARNILEKIIISDTINLVHIDKGHGDAGWWLWDDARGMNLAIKAKSEREAFSDALKYYQRRLTDVESAHKCLSARVEAFVSQFADEDE